MCFSLDWLAHLIVWLIVLAAVVAIIRVLIPWVTGPLGVGPQVVQIINIVLWAVVAIAVVYLCFDLIECLVGAGMGFPRLHH